MNSPIDSPSSPPKPAAGGKAPAAKKKSPRRRSRELALQGLYEWKISGSEPGVIDAHIRELDDYSRCDTDHFNTLLHGCIRESQDLNEALAQHLDRPTSELSPVEHATLLIGSYELKHCIDIPYKVVINESVELAKSFGGTDGHKYVNGVLDKAAAQLRAVEVQAARQGHTGR